jgi:dipeptidase
MRLLPLLLIICSFNGAQAATNIIAGSGATTDASVLLAFTHDSHAAFGHLYFYKGASYSDTSTIDIPLGSCGKRCFSIKQASQTFTVVGIMNENQVSISEASFHARPQLSSNEPGLGCSSLINIALQRSLNARHAISTISALADEYGYSGPGSSLSIADPREAWIMEFVPRGNGKKGIAWVALRLPEWAVSVQANISRIGSFPLNEPSSCMYSLDVISHARELGLFSGRDTDFIFSQAYSATDNISYFNSAARIWRALSILAPGDKLPMPKPEVSSSKPELPLWIRPARKQDMRSMSALLRDHFTGTAYDMAQGIAAGPHASPYRDWPLTWRQDTMVYMHPRPVSIAGMAYSGIAQMRQWMPHHIGGILWFGVDDSFFTCYQPMYCGISAAPVSLAAETASRGQFSWQAQFWSFNFVANFAYPRFQHTAPYIIKAQQETEAEMRKIAKTADSAALALYTLQPDSAQSVLTAMSAKAAESAHSTWINMGQELMVRFIDGAIMQPASENAEFPGYPHRWRRIIAPEAQSSPHR